jgi:hypothetical protein
MVCWISPIPHTTGSFRVICHVLHGTYSILVVIAWRDPARFLDFGEFWDAMISKLLRPASVTLKVWVELDFFCNCLFGFSTKCSRLWAYSKTYHAQNGAHAPGRHAYSRIVQTFHHPLHSIYPSANRRSHLQAPSEDSRRLFRRNDL